MYRVNSMSRTRNLALVLALVASLWAPTATRAEDRDDLPWSERMAATLMRQFPDEPWLMRKSDGAYRWSYTNGLVLKGIEHVYAQNPEQRYFDYIKAYADHYIDADGRIETYTSWDYNIDSINAGKMLFFLHEKTGDERYLKAMRALRAQLDWHPRTSEGGFWHKLKYPWQLWLDGAYMAGPFYARYEVEFGRGDQGLDDVVNWYRVLERRTRDRRTGLLYHGWDESRVQPWADNETGRSANFWSRAMGWYAMALIDTIEVLPADYIGRADLQVMLWRLVDALIPYQHETGLWYQVTDQGDRKGNYLEASGSSMFVYSIAKAVRLGVLPASYQAIADKGYQGLIDELVSVDEQGNVLLRNVCRSAGLGGDPYRDGSYEYYLSEDIVVNDAHGVGSFILASVEMGR